VGGESSIDQRGCQNIENRSRPSTFCNLFGIYSETIFIRRSTFTGNYACNDYSADIKIVTVQLLFLLSYAALQFTVKHVTVTHFFMNHILMVMHC